MSDPQSDLAKIQSLLIQARNIESILAEENVFPEIKFREYVRTCRASCEILIMALQNIELVLPKSSN